MQQNHPETPDDIVAAGPPIGCKPDLVLNTSQPLQPQPPSTLGSRRHGEFYVHCIIKAVLPDAPLVAWKGEGKCEVYIPPEIER